MTEQEWLASEDPQVMLNWLRGTQVARGFQVNRHDGSKYDGGPSDRKLRLFAVACRLQVYGNLGEYEVVDQSDGLTDPHGGSAYSMAEVWCRYITSEDTRAALAHRANLLRDIAGNPFRPVTLPRNPDCSACRGSGTFAVGNGEDAERMRCRCCPWLTPAVVSLAHAAYDHRDDSTGHLDPFRLALVADALEEAGCPLGDDPPKTLHKCPHCGSPGRYCSICYGTSKVLAACGTCLDKKRIWTGMDGMKWYPCGVCPKPTPHPILAHLRGPGPHARGCHIIDLLTGRE